MLKPTPPQIPGLPIVGNLVQFLNNREQLLKHGLNTFGPIFSIKLANQPTAILIGPEYQQIFFTETDKKLSLHKTYAFLKAAFGEVGFTAPPEVYFKQRPILLSPFKSDKMPGYLSIMQLEVQQWLDTLGDSGEFELTSSMNSLVQNVAAHTLMGKAFRDIAGDEFWQLYLHIGQAINPAVPHYLPLPRNIRRDKAKNKLRAILRPILAERRAHPDNYNDFLQDFVNARFKDGTPLDDEIILSLILGLLFAGHETTAGQSAWTIINLLQHPDYLKLLQTEIDTNLPYQHPINAKTLSSLRHVFWAVQETTRLNPSADILLRRAEEDLDVGAYRVPQGWNLMVTAGIAHKLPTLFKDPETYDPLRFAPDRKEDAQHRFSIIGFGGHTHKCAGMNFANNEMMIITTLLFQQFNLQLLSPNPQTDHSMGANRPTKTLIRYTRKPQPSSPLTATPTNATQCPHLHTIASEN